MFVNGTNKIEVLTRTLIADDSEATQVAKKDFGRNPKFGAGRYPAATKFFLQVTGGGDV